MAKAVRIHTPGGPENLVYETVDCPDPGPEDVLIKQEYCGLNYIDVYHRTGLYPMPLPNAIGMEASGIVIGVGDAVSELAVGDRVAYAAPPVGAYATERVMPWDRVVKLPDHISNEAAAAMMLKGMTVEYLIRRTYAVQKGDSVLFQAVAGGVGLAACQWLKQIGANIIGTVGSEAKAELAREAGCDHVILYRTEDVAARVRELTDGAGVPVVYDGVGAATLDGSLDSLKPRGLFVSFGNASGPVTDFNPAILSAKGSLYMTRPTLMTYTASREDMVASASALFDAVARGLTFHIHQRYDLADAKQAHLDLEARKTTGSTLLVV